MDFPIAVVLAAGKGTRMNSELPKVLFPVLGRPMIHFVLDALEQAGIQRVLVVVGYRQDLVRQELEQRSGVEFVVQDKQLGTGHAVLVCRDALREHKGAVTVVTGDAPLLQGESISTLLRYFSEFRPACLLGTLKTPMPSGLGRILRDQTGEFVRIVEEKDATDGQRAITEVNMSTYVFDCQSLLKALDQLGNENRQSEYYITDCPGILKMGQQDVRALPVLKPYEGLGVNRIEDISAVEAEMTNLGY